MRFWRTVGTWSLVLALGACTSPQPNPLPSETAPSNSCRDIPQEPLRRGQQREVQGYLNVRHFPYPEAEGLGVDPKAIIADLECVLNAEDGWASAGMRFSLNGKRDNGLFHIILLPKHGMDDEDLDGWCKPLELGCYRTVKNSPENLCVVTLGYTPGMQATTIAGVIHHQVGHCLLGSSHSLSGLMAPMPSVGNLVMTARPTEQEKSAVRKRLQGKGPIFLPGLFDAQS
ncbi:MAG TPA: hypothetical protein VFT87_00310 [Candidatus Saccharimonadales bacterium]|nr:hypothetical protein [Candidatus Saccharimonadales bacterium]